MAGWRSGQEISPGLRGSKLSCLAGQPTELTISIGPRSRKGRLLLVNREGRVPGSEPVIVQTSAQFKLCRLSKVSSTTSQSGKSSVSDSSFGVEPSGFYPAKGPDHFGLNLSSTLRRRFLGAPWKPYKALRLVSTFANEKRKSCTLVSRPLSTLIAEGWNKQ